MNLDRKLREMNGEGAKFGESQREGLKAIMGRQGRVVVARGTGSQEFALHVPHIELRIGDGQTFISGNCCRLGALG